MMTSGGIRFSLELGALRPAPAPAAVMEAFDSVDITHVDAGPSMFQMRFRADRSAGLASDYDLLASGLLQPFTRVLMTVTLSGTPQVLFDGFITHQELVHDKQSGASTIAVSGEDVSVLMDLLEVSLQFPGLSDAEIVMAVLVKYSAIGIVPEIVPSLTSLATLPVDEVATQHSTDRAWLNQIAAPHGYVFYVRPGPAKLTNTAYWGPPVRTGTMQPALSIDMLPATNVESISFQYDALAPVNVYGWGKDPETEEDFPIVTGASRRLPPFASRPALIVNQPYVRKQLFSDPRLGLAAGLDSAQSVTDVSTDRVVTGSGSLDTLRYGNVLNAPGVVSVRGIGSDYDGVYQVQTVTHKIRPGSYTQDFVIAREGQGTTVSRVSP